MKQDQAAIDIPAGSAGLNDRRSRVSRHAENRPVDCRVLVVDDDAIICGSVAKILETFGYTVSKAEDGIAAMSHLATSQYDLVITDFEMPMMDGYRLSTWLKQESPRTIAIVMTGSCQAEVNQFMATGLVDRWLFKPFRLKELREALHKFGLPTERSQSI